MKTISIISPCFNEQESIDYFFTEIFKVINQISDHKFEIIVVNDGSSDGSLDALNSYVQDNDMVRVIDLNRNFGKEIALTAGFDHAIGDAAIVIDFDLQHPPCKIKEFINLWQQGYESVIAIRKDRRLDGALKRGFSNFFYKIYNIFSDIKLKNGAGDFGLFDRKIIDQIKAFPEKHRFMKGIFSWLGAKTAYIEYDVLERKLGSSKFSGVKLWNFAIDGITSFSVIPLKIWTYIGFSIAFSSFIYGVYIAINTLINGVITPGYSSIIVAILFLSGIQIMGIGILGEYLGRVYIESKHRPLYLVRQILESKKKS